MTKNLHANIWIMILVPLLIVISSYTLLVGISDLTWSSALYFAAALFFLISFFRYPIFKTLRLFGFFLLFTISIIRILTVADGKQIHIHSISETSSRFIDRLFVERDIAVVGSRLLRFTKLGGDAEIESLPTYMKDAYDRMHGILGDTSSPVIATLFGLQRPGNNDVIELGDIRKSKGVIVYLHGWLGNFVLPCWQLWEAVKSNNMGVICPSMNWRAQWWTEDGTNIIQQTISDLQKLGVHHIFLAGLSNGAIGALKFSKKNAHTLKGLILISGATPEKTSLIPTLIIRGSRDRNLRTLPKVEDMSESDVSQVDLDAGHFAMLTKESDIRTVIRAWTASKLPLKKK